jgi:hypothetical protein
MAVVVWIVNRVLEERSRILGIEAKHPDSIFRGFSCALWEIF